VDRTVYCMTCLLYFGRPGEAPVAVNKDCHFEEGASWISQQLGLFVFHIVGMVFGIELRWCWQCLLTRWEHSATYCNSIRFWHDAVDRPRTFYTLQNARQDTANIRVTVDSTCLHCLISCRKLQKSVCWRLVSYRVLSHSRLCTAITHDQWFQQCAVT